MRSLHDIYYDIYRMVKMGFNAEYVENLSPAERGVYKGYSEMENHIKNDDGKNANAAKLAGLNIEDLI